MNIYIDEEKKLWGEYMEIEDYAKFVIQSYTGPFHSLKTAPDIRTSAERFKKEFNDTHLFVKQREIFQQISERCLRIHIVPFMRKYKSMQLLSGMFVDTFSFISGDFLAPVPSDVSFLSSIPDAGAVGSIIEKFNSSGEMPSHSDKYKSGVHPAYFVSVNEVIKKYMKVL